MVTTRAPSQKGCDTKITHATTSTKTDRGIWRRCQYGVHLISLCCVNKHLNPVVRKEGCLGANVGTAFGIELDGETVLKR